MRSFFSIIAGPVVCLGILSGISWENRRHTKPSDAEPFHQAAKAAVESWPTKAGNWVGRDDRLPVAAIQLLKPNSHFCRRYFNTTDRQQPSVSLLVVQCRDPIDMSGHYPPNCYPNSGEPKVHEERRTWTVPGVAEPIVGMEYHFESGLILQPRTIVYNFFVLPGKGIVADMADVREASGNYQRRHYGATQIQVVFVDSPHADQAWRDEVFATLIGSHASALAVLSPAIK